MRIRNEDKPQSGICTFPVTFDMEKIVAHAKSLTREQWQEWSYRQETWGIHARTQSIPIQNYTLFESGYRPELIQRHRDYEAVYWPLLKDIIEYLETKHDGKMLRCLMINLDAGGEIPLHRDSGISLEHAARHHVPVITNPDVIFDCGSDSINMKVGHCYEIHNNIPHRVMNGGDQDRVHLVIDIMPRRFC